MAAEKTKKPRATKASSNPSTSTKAVFSTNYANAVLGQHLDGQQIARNFRTFNRMYRVNSDLRRCISEIQETTMKAGYEVSKVNRTDGKKKAVTIDTFETALKFKKSSAKTLKNDIIQQIEIFGNAFIRKRRNIRQQVIGWEVLDTRFISIITDDDLTPLRYLYQSPVRNSQIETYPAEDILHVKANTDFDNPLFGMTVLETIVLDVMADDEANLSNYFFFQNDAIPSALYVLEKGMDDPTQKLVFEQIKQTMTGGHNKNKSIVSSGVSEIKVMSPNHKDMDFINQRKYTTEKICAALGVPKIILGYTEGVNYSNANQQYTKYIENTIRPFEGMIEDIFTELLLDFGSDLIFVVKDEHIDDFEQRVNIGIKLVQNGAWNRNRLREYIGDPREENEMLDQYTITTNTQLLDTLPNTEAVGAIDPANLPPQA